MRKKHKIRLMINAFYEEFKIDKLLSCQSWLHTRGDRKCEELNTPNRSKVVASRLVDGVYINHLPHVDVNWVLSDMIDRISGPRNAMAKLTKKDVCKKRHPPSVSWKRLHVTKPGAYCTPFSTMRNITSRLCNQYPAWPLEPKQSSCEMHLTLDKNTETLFKRPLTFLRHIIATS